jgi:hypothetical protein
MPRRRASPRRSPSPAPPAEAIPRADFGAQLRGGWRDLLTPLLGLLSDEQAFGLAQDGRGQDPWCGRPVGRYPGRPPRLMVGVSCEAVLEGADVGRVLAPPSVCVFACLVAKWRWLTPRLRESESPGLEGDCFFEAVTEGDPGHLRTRLGWFLGGDGRRSGHRPTVELLRALHARAGTEPGTPEAEAAALPASVRGQVVAIQRSGWAVCGFCVFVVCFCCVRWAGWAVCVGFVLSFRRGCSCAMPGTSSPSPAGRRTRGAASWCTGGAAWWCSASASAVRQSSCSWRAGTTAASRGGGAGGYKIRWAGEMRKHKPMYLSHISEDCI